MNQNPEIVIRQIKLLENLEVIIPSVTLIRRGIQILQAHKISFWDSQIIAQAESADCDIIYSEDFQNGQFISGIRIENPFLIK